MPIQLMMFQTILCQLIPLLTQVWKLNYNCFFTHKIFTIRMPTDIDDISEMKAIVLSAQ